MSGKILIVTTNRGYLSDEIHKTGTWLEEFAVPYLKFKQAELDITICSPKGGKTPVDESSTKCLHPKSWDDAAKNLEHTKKIDDIKYEEFDAVFIPGGHGPMFDLANNKKLGEIVEYLYKNKKIVAAVCHGPAGLLTAIDSNGTPFVKGKKLTSFTNKEEKLVKKDKLVPFPLETRLRELGAHFFKKDPWEENVVVDENLVTGQNPQSSELIAREILCLLGKYGERGIRTLDADYST